MNLLAALLIYFTPIADCDSDGKREMRELYRETENLIDQIEAEYMRGRGLTDEAIELRDELRSKYDELKEWAARCRPVVPRRSGL
jgi:hypothetical protein